MLTQNQNSSGRWRRWSWLGSVALCLLAVSCQSPQPVDQTSAIVEPDQAAARPDHHAAAGLRRSEDVIRAKLAGKQRRTEQRLRTDAAQNPDKALEQRREQRLGNDGTIRPNALMLAKAQAEMMAELPMDPRPTRDAGIWNWEWLGPGNIGGRIRSILVNPDDPSIMYVGGVSGGVWKTTDGGNYWYPLTDFLPSLAVASMVMDPGNPNIIYAGTGEGLGGFDLLPGAGIFKSVDGGASWTQLVDTIPTDVGEWGEWKHVNRLAIKASDGSKLVAATS